MKPMENIIENDHRGDPGTLGMVNINEKSNRPETDPLTWHIAQGTLRFPRPPTAEPLQTTTWQGWREIARSPKRMHYTLLLRVINRVTPVQAFPKSRCASLTDFQLSMIQNANQSAQNLPSVTRVVVRTLRGGCPSTLAGVNRFHLGRS